MDKNKCQEKSDEELVRLSLSNQDYFYCLASRYEDKLMRYILRLCCLSRHDAEDILQNALIKIYRYLNDFNPDLKFSSWAYRIVHNEAMSFLRYNKSRPDINSHYSQDDIAKIISQTDLEKEIDYKINLQNLESTLLKLDNKYREVIILKFLEDKNYQEISDIIHKPIGTVATLISRAKKQLKKYLPYG